MYWAPAPITDKASDALSAPSIALVSHLDTVYPIDVLQRRGHAWTPYKASDASDGGTELSAVLHGESRVRGPGTIDIHGGSICAIAALASIQATDPVRFHGTGWHLWLNAAEEEMTSDFGPAAESFMRRTGTAPSATGAWMHTAEELSGSEFDEPEGAISESSSTADGPTAVHVDPSSTTTSDSDGKGSMRSSESS